MGLISAEFSTITSEDGVFIFYFTESIFFHGVLFETSVRRGYALFTKG